VSPRPCSLPHSHRGRRSPHAAGAPSAAPSHRREPRHACPPDHDLVDQEGGGEGGGHDDEVARHRSSSTASRSRRSRRSAPSAGCRTVGRLAQVTERPAVGVQVSLPVAQHVTITSVALTIASGPSTPYIQGCNSAPSAIPYPTTIETIVAITGTSRARATFRSARSLVRSAGP